MELEAIVEDLASLPGALGAIVCDYEGEAVVHALGDAPIPPEVLASAVSHIPRSVPQPAEMAEFLLRLVGAEPCAVLRLFQETALRQRVGGIQELDIRYRGLDLLVHRLPDEYYVVLVLRRPALVARGRAKLRGAGVQLRALLS